MKANQRWSLTAAGTGDCASAGRNRTAAKIKPNTAVPADQIMPLRASIQKCDTMPNPPMTYSQKIQPSSRRRLRGTRKAMGTAR